MVPDLGKSPSQENGALAGIIGPAVFALVVVVLTLVQYDFMVGLGWHPVRGSDVPWPSGLALGPLGWLQVANFVLLFSLLPAFFFLWWRLRNDPLWRGYGQYTLITGVLCVFLFFRPEPVAF